MNLISIAARNLRQRTLASSLTTLSVMLGVMLMVEVLVINRIIEQQFSRNATGYELIVGAKGGRLELVLNTIFHIGRPIENVPYLYFKKLQRDKRVKYALPLAFGDFTKEGGFTIVGTTPEFFEVPYLPDREFRIRGRLMEERFDAIIGSEVARRNGWQLGHKFQPVHSVKQADEDAHVHEEQFEVVGILAPTGTPNDKAVFVHLDGFLSIADHEKPLEQAQEKVRLLEVLAGEELQATGVDPTRPPPHDHGHDHGHDHDHGHAHDGHAHEPIPDVQKEVTAILIVTQGGVLPALMEPEINKGPFAQAVNPGREIYNLMQNLVWNVRLLLIVLTGIVIAVSGVGIFVSIYNTMSERRREIALFRALGASRETVFGMILIESLLICVAGGLSGILVGHLLVFAAAPIVESRTGMLIDPWAWDKTELLIMPCLAVMAVVVGLLPGLAAYRTDVARGLQQS